MFLAVEWSRLLGIWSWRGSLDSRCHNRFAVGHTNACKCILEVVFCCCFHIAVSHSPIPAPQVYATFHRPHNILYSDKQPLFERIVKSHHSVDLSYRQRVVDVNGCPEVRFPVIKSSGRAASLVSKWMAGFCRIPQGHFLCRSGKAWVTNVTLRHVICGSRIMYNVVLSKLERSRAA